jgi:hypothetical protein
MTTNTEVIFIATVGMIMGFVIYLYPIDDPSSNSQNREQISKEAWVTGCT